MNNGSGTGSYPVGAVVVLVADTPPSGQVFSQWTGRHRDGGGRQRGFDDDDDADGDATVTASYQDEATPVEYLLTVNNGSGTGSYPAGAVVVLVADAPPSGQVFSQWTGDTGTVADVNAASTTMTMPTGDATVTASYQAVSGGGTFSFGPSDDAYLQGSTRFNDAYLKVEAGYRVSYLKFSVGAVRKRGTGDAAVAGERGSGEWHAAGVSRQSPQLDGSGR